VTLILEVGIYRSESGFTSEQCKTVGIYKWYVTHHLVMMHVSINFYEILFIHLEVVVQTM